MDIFTHMIVGAASEHLVGNPLVAAVGAVVPDLALPITYRLAKPNVAYRVTHSLIPVLVLSALSFMDSMDFVPLLVGWISHILLDIPTHGTQWEPQLLWPFCKKTLPHLQEWEFFNSSWWVGLTISVVWVVICLYA